MVYRELPAPLINMTDGHPASLGVSWIIIVIITVITSALKAEDICSEYDGVSTSECTDGFPSLFHIDDVLRNTDLSTLDSRQVIIPAINFTCNGSIKRWIFGAQWYGRSPAHLELQIWRRNSTTLYTKVDGTVITPTGRNNSGVYEYQLDTPLNFQEGDIFGYFQPTRNRSDIILYLEESRRLTIFHKLLSINDIEPPTPETIISLSSTSVDSDYPLVAVRTDPSDCGCGFMSVERVYALLDPSRDRGDRENFRREELVLFPSMTFMCSGEVVKWIVGSTRLRLLEEMSFELQVWRLSNNTDNTYEKVGSTPLLSERPEDDMLDDFDDNVYEFSVDSNITVRPGDIFGMYFLRSITSRAIEYDEDFDAEFYFIKEPTNASIFDISHFDVRSDYGLPLISAEIALFRSSAPTPTTSPQQLFGTVFGNESTHTVPMTSAPAPTRLNNPSREYSTLSREHVATIVGASILAVVVAVIVGFILVLVKKKSRKHANISESVVYKSRNTQVSTSKSTEGELGHKDIHLDATQPTMNANEAYDVHQFSVSGTVFGGSVKQKDIASSWNDAYAVTLRGNKEANEECVYEYVDRNAAMAENCVPNQAYGQIMQQNDANDENEYI